jgi:hypothetical protein
MFGVKAYYCGWFALTRWPGGVLEFLLQKYYSIHHLRVCLAIFNRVFGPSVVVGLNNR